jgi:hypothetical protein
MAVAGTRVPMGAKSMRATRLLAPCSLAWRVIGLAQSSRRL